MLGNIQNLILQLTIDPVRADQFFADPESFQVEFALSDEELSFAKQLPQKAITDFQISVCRKRSRRVYDAVKRTSACLQQQKGQDVFRSFAIAHVMRSNEWPNKIPAFFDHVESALGDTVEDGVLREVVSFERWMYNIDQGMLQHDVAGRGIVRTPQAQIHSFLVPAEPLLDEWVSPELRQILMEGYGQSKSFVLALQTGDEIELFEIDACIYEILMQCEKPQSKEALTAVVQTAIQKHEVDKQPQEVLAELEELGILIEIGEEA
ncbi:hypothetical protein CBW65_07195 [Tumebacillus avium]|uniref:DNA-binding domain-containing protein n=1 Tax=Tumebacillus avium TaxID=1903704 RepID=A0A1Y0ILJ0_9BACL|nr:hypothetical protein [Tumebacillus avium]ARU60909.1 hypothetical protein CBW65_07195 [Tumebacillus avium]